MIKKMKLIGAFLALALIACIAVTPQMKAQAESSYTEDKVGEPDGTWGNISVEDRHFYRQPGGNMVYIGSNYFNYQGPLPGVGGMIFTYGSIGAAVSGIYHEYMSNGGSYSVSAQGGGMCSNGDDLPRPCWMQY